jgi:putative heme-binding domain-containing protein
VRVSGDPTGPLFARAAQAPGVEEYRRFALEHPGDPRAGYALFRQPSGPICARCHAVFGEGGRVGPDLSDVAAKYGADELLRSILEPSQRIAEGYAAIAFEMTSGPDVFGRVERETAETIEIYDTNGELRTLERADVVSRTPGRTSVMPEGLAALLTKEQFADLFAYVRTLRGGPK